ncbi:hypothetical protein TWF281_000924 [Arthrobotrys megalospora]
MSQAREDIEGAYSSALAPAPYPIDRPRGMAAEEMAFHIQSVVADCVKEGMAGGFHRMCLGVADLQTAAAGSGTLLGAHSFVVVDIEDTAMNPVGWGMAAVRIQMSACTSRRSVSPGSRSPNGRTGCGI